MKTLGWSVFNYADYKTLLNDLITARSEQSVGLKKKLSEACGMNPTYLSQVLHSKAHLTEEQLLRLARFFAFSDLEINYLQVLLRIAKAGTPDLRSFQENERKRLLQQSKDLKKRFTKTDTAHNEVAATYYSQWYYSAVHIALYIPKFQNIRVLESALALPGETMNGIIKFLVSTKLIKETKAGHYVPLESDFHLPQNSPEILKHHTNWRLQGLRSLEKKSPTDLHYSSVVSIAEKDIPKFQNLFIRAVEESREMVGTSSPEESLCAYCVDFFKIT